MGSKSTTKYRWDLDGLSEDEASKKKKAGMMWTKSELDSIPADWHRDWINDGNGLRGRIRIIKTGEGEKDYKIDIRFTYSYRFNGKTSTFLCGNYPALGIAEIRKIRDAAKNDVAQGVDPNSKRQADKIAKQQEIARIFEEEKERQRQIEYAKSRTLGQYLQTHYKDHQARKKSGADTIAMIRRNFGHLFDVDMASLTKQHIHDWQDEREAKGRAYATIQRAYGALKTLLNTAVKTDGVISTNPLANVSLKERNANNDNEERLKLEREAERRALTAEEIEKLKLGLNLYAEEIRQQRRNSRAHGKAYLPCLDDVAYPHWFIPFCYVALYTGLRSGDIYSLTWGNKLNIPFKQLRVTPNKTKHHSDPAQIIQPIPAPLHEIMAAWWKQNGKPQTGLVFPSDKTGGEISKGTHAHHWRKIVSLAGLDEHLVFYSLRHNFISTLIANNVPLFEVAALAGHKDTKMIEKHYGHLLPDKAKTAMDIIGNAFGGESEEGQEEATQNDNTNNHQLG